MSHGADRRLFVRHNGRVTVSGNSAHWFNKSDHGVIIERNLQTEQSTIHISKVRFDESGARGAIKMRFDIATQRFSQLNDEVQETLL